MRILPIFKFEGEILPRKWKTANRVVCKYIQTTVIGFVGKEIYGRIPM